MGKIKGIAESEMNNRCFFRKPYFTFSIVNINNIKSEICRIGETEHALMQ